MLRLSKTVNRLVRYLSLIKKKLNMKFFESIQGLVVWLSPPHTCCVITTFESSLACVCVCVCVCVHRSNNPTGPTVTISLYAYNFEFLIYDYKITHFSNKRVFLFTLSAFHNTNLKQEFLLYLSQPVFFFFFLFVFYFI